MTSAKLRQHASSRPGTTVLRLDSHSAAFEAFVRAQEPFDRVLSDGDHSAERFLELVDQHPELRARAGVGYPGIGMAIPRDGGRPPR